MFVIQIPPAPAPVPTPISTPSWDLTRGLIDATVQLDQPDGNGRRTVGTGFLVDAPRPDGTPRTVLVTAAHVLERMPDSEARIGWRIALPDGAWRFTPEPLRIREADRTPVWTRHPERDIAVMEIVAPEAFARAAIPLGWLAEATEFDRWQVGPGDELLSLGFPRGLSANRAGFPILRVGRIASWPLTPIAAFPTFLLDFPVHAGNSGGPVFWTPGARRLPGTPVPDHPFIAGVLVQAVEVDGEGLGIGVVAHARYVREAIARMDAAAGP
ncbi:serine protease [uncultured Brevundimonas sp.]|uniref:S1 family peptidase n=1 Tax=uncultured Brevundimonas sp. TaxID=213418 RepID=UPI0030EE6910|tara:strand:+ start:1561 stop:2370 length:810 start_codon:yes stop_codon:yes gene_type:complete